MNLHIQAVDDAATCPYHIDRFGDHLNNCGNRRISPHSARVSTAFNLTEKIRQIIATREFNLGNPLRVTCSFAISELAINEQFEAAFKRADEALYKAKREGRNCSIIAWLTAAINSSSANDVVSSGPGCQVENCPYRQTSRRRTKFGANCLAVASHGKW